jgi:N12 class adenine-specific DNA methylase
MPIFEYNGKKYNVREEHIDSFMKDFPDASTIMEREGKKYRVKSADYKTFMSEQQQPEQTAPDSTPETPVISTAKEKPLTEQDKIRFSANMGQMKRRTEQMLDGFSEQMETMREYQENAPLGGGQTAEGKIQFNPESGKLEKTYITPLGNRYTSKGLADMESFRYRQAADMSVSGQLRRARLKLAELQEKRDASANRVHEQWEEDTKKNTAPLGFLLAADTYVPRQMSDRENSTLDVAIRQTEELIKDLEEQKDREQGVDVGFWRGFGRVAGDFRTWDFGMSDMRDALTMMNADDLKGENATDGEREAYNEMMGALYNKGQAEQMYGGNAGFWNRAGMMTGHMPAFMLDFGITGGGFNGINVLSKAGTKAATKVVGKEVVEQMAKQGFKAYVKNNGVKGLGQYATNWTIKALGTTADDLLLRAPLMTNTVQAGKTTADIIDRKLGDVVVDENGNYDFSNDKTWGDAIWQGEANAIVENYSEMFGSHLDPVVTLGNMGKLANVVGAKRIGAVLSKADAGALNGIMGQTHQLFNKMGVSDYFGEVTEEYYGQLWRTMLNLDDAYQQNPDGTRTNLLATGQFHGDIWGGMALSMGLMGAGKATLSGAQYASMKHGVNKADARATELLGKEIWEPLRTTIDLTTNDDIGSVAEGIVNDKDFSDDERAAVLTYMEHSLMMRGFNLGTLAQKRGGEQDEDVQSMNESYIDGYNIADPQEMTDAKNMRDYQRQRVSAIVDEDTLGFLDAHPLNALEEMRNNCIWGESELETVLDYLNAKQVYDGMIQRVRDDIDARVEQSNAMVDARTNRTTGMIQGATMKQDDRRVYVVSGNLVLYADGSGIDNKASDDSIIVRDAETGALEQVSPDAVLNIDKPLNPSDEKMTAEDAIIQQFAQEASDKIDGVVTFNPGDTYTITGDDAQIQVQIIANEDGIVDNGDGTVNVSDGVNIFPLAKETIQQQTDAANLARVAQFEQQRTIENAERKQEIQEADRPQYALNDIVSLIDENGVTVRGNITADVNADGRYEVFTEAPINGKRVNLFTRDELDNMLLEHNGVAFERPADNENNNGVENIPENGNNTPQNIGSADLAIPAMQRIPKDEQGNPLYEQTDSDTAWDAIVEQTEGDEVMAQTVADGMVADKEEALKKQEKAKSKGGNSIAEKIASEKERKAAIDAAKQELLVWQKIAGTANRRKMEADAERRRIADEAAALRKAEEEKLRAEREEVERIEREALNGVPDMVDDKPQDARARGYRRMNGHKIDRQEPVQALMGKEVSVKFSDDAIVGGRISVIDANLLQPSHVQGVRNPLHFIDEAQPKERNDEASVLSARKIAGNIRPEEITSSVTAYTGAPTINARGEVIQGNNRSDALRQMWYGHKDQAEQYKQYLKDHADEFGLRAEDIDSVERPVLVNMLEVDDTEAINLGQFVAQDTESGGIERIKPKNIMQKMGNDMRSFANLLLASSDEETSFAGLVDANGTNVLKWMMQKGYITPTQYSSAFDSKGNLTAEAKNDLRGIMYQSIFKGGSVRLEEMFNALPVKAQKAILVTAFRDYDSPNAERMVEEIQNSIRAYYALSQDKQFTEAKNFKEARIAVESWKHQYQIDDATGESYLPADNFSNFALLLATMYKGETQGIIQNTFNRIYDLIQGTQEATLFEQPDNTPRTLAQAIYETLNIIYDGQQRSNVLVGDTATGQRGQQGSRGDAQAGERVEDGNGTADSGGRIERDGGRSGVESEDRGNKEEENDATEVIGRSMTADEAQDFIADMELSAEIAPEIDLTIENWDALFGEDGIVTTPIGNVKMGENQFTKLMRQGRNGKLGMIKPTLEHPHAIIEDVSEAKEGDTTERPSSYVFIRSFKKADGSRYYYFTSITVSKDGKEVVVSNQEKRRNAIANLLTKGKMVWKHADNVSDASDMEQGLYSPQGNVSDLATEGTDAPQTTMLSDSKGTNNSVKSSELGEKIAAAEAEVDVNPTEAQKEAGNYKKGHVQVGVFDITIEQPKGSVRSGVDANGNKWETTMQNTYGYIRGTEGMDGDHIDVFLSDDIDGWNGRQVFVVDQRNEDGSFDEHKVMLGFNDINDAEAAYMSNYEEGWQGLGAITGVAIEDFEKWIASSHRKTKAFAEYKTVKTTEGQSASAERRNLADFKEGDVVRDYYDKKLYRIKKHSKNGVSTIAMLDEEGNEISTTQMNAHNNSRYSIAEAPVKAETPNISQEADQVSDQVSDAPYSIAPAQYTTKKGKVLDMHLVKFAGTLTKEQQRAAKELAKADKGWYDREQGGFMMRSEDSAKQLAETIISDEEAVSDAQPVSLADTRKVVQPQQVNAESLIGGLNKKGEAKLSDHVEQPANPSGNRLVTDERYAELRERMRKKLGGQMNIGIDPEILAIGTEMAVYHLEKGARKFAEYATAMIADLGDAIRPYLKAFYNGARNLPEVESSEIAADMTPYDEVQQFNVATFGKEHSDPFTTAEIVVAEQAHEQEAEQAKQEIINQRNTERRNEDEQTSANTETIASQAEAVASEAERIIEEATTEEEITEVEQRIDEQLNAIDEQLAKFNIDDLHSGMRAILKDGRNVLLSMVMHSGEQISATQMSKPRVHRLYATYKGQFIDFAPEDVDIDATRRLLEADEVAPVETETKKEKPKKSKKKAVTLQQSSELGLFDSLFDNETNNENGLQRTDAERSEGVSANGNRHEQGLSRGTETSSESKQQDSRGTDLGGKRTGDAVDRTVRPRLSDTVTEPKNTRNNHSERGKDHAPTSVDARIEANIKAIELAQQLIESSEQATEKQMQTLRKFSGWGGLGKVFSEGIYYAPNNIAKRLRELLGEAAYQEAVMSANSAYYTPAYVVDTLWDIAEQMGFKGGNILEGSAGIGNILGQMPTHISEQSDIHAIEIDGTSGGILSLLYPDAKVEIQGFEQTRIANGSVDLAITNVPFVTGLRVNDTTGDKDLSKKFHNIHDFCIAKNVRKLREGGLGIFITSNGTLDSSKKLRDWIVNEGGADFVGAFRMHNKTFGGTGVTSDIIVIRKRVNGKKSAHAIDVSNVSGERMAEYNTGETRKKNGQIVPVVKQLSMDYNQYFIEHPENMAGEMHFAFEKGDTFRPTSKGLYPKQDKKQEQMLAEFVQSFTAEEFGDKATDEIEVIDAIPGKKIGEVFISDGKLYINAIGAAQPLEVNANKVKGHTKVECFEAYTAIKEALAEVLDYQTNNDDDKGLKPLLAKLNKAYDDFVATYGHFNKNTAIAFLRNDVDYANVFALEKFEETADAKGNKVQKFGKTDVFSKRVVEKEKEPTPTNVKDGIIASIFKFGRVDVPYIAEQLGQSEEAVKKEIIESGYGFEDPTTRQIEVSYQYLSGNVREKLRQAQENNENGEYDSNIKALQEVVPMDIPAHLIDFTLGSSWIEPKMYEEYVKERTEVGVQFTAVGGTWFMNEPYFTNYEKNRAMGVTSEMLGRTVMGHTLIEAAIQNRSITVSTVKKNWDGSTETITDKEATQACAAKIDEIRQDFKEWARQKMQSDAEMSERMERIYNDTFNNYVPMSIPDDFVPEYFGGASHKFKMRPHQGRAIVRGTMQPLLLAHEVGTGKTFTLISTAMEMRRLGTARKPMIVVQNATVGQFVASAKELYPNAKILTLEEADRSAEGRKNFYAKIRYNDWDMIVVPQSTFEFIPDSEERQMAFVQSKIEEKMLVLEKMKEADPNGKSMITRQAEREIELLEEQLAGLSDESAKKRTAADEKKRAVALQNAEVKAMEMLDRRTDDVENFDDMGIDALLIDEAHEYKHLGFATAMQRGVKGVDPSYSKKSQGVYLKTQAVLEKNNGRNVIFATGTPISNTAAEIWTFMRYLMPADTMEEYGIYYFDDFVRNFGNIQQMLEFTTSGKFKENNRFAGYVNLPELVRIWSGVSDTVLTREAGGVSDKIPEMEESKAQDLYLPQTRALRSIMKFVKAQLEEYDKMSGKEKKENSHIPLTMYGIAKAAAVDARLVQSDAEDDAHSKTNEAVRQTLRSLKETADYKGTVAIFADNYQNKESGFNLYEDIRAKLIAEGVPADEIVVMKSGMTVKKKLEIFEKVNRGEVRVILGSTFTLGTGVNIQERLHTLIHLDAPNRPMDYTQRNGRILRQGNLHKAMGKPVRVLRFGVEDSLDVTAYQRLKTKGAIADSIMNGKQMMANSMTNRVLEEEEDVFGDTVAQLSGSEYAMLKNNAEKNVRKYASRKKQWEADQTYIHNAKPRIKAFIKDAEKRIEDNSRYLEAVQSAFPDGKFTEIIIGKHRFASVEAMEDFFKEHNKSVLAEMKQMKDGEIAGEQKRELTIKIGDFSFVVTTKLTRQTVRDGATLFNDVERKMHYSCPELGIEDIPVRQNLLRNAIEDITKNVITGRDFAERLEAAHRNKKHNEAELEQLLSREGKPFEYEAELAQAREQYDDYAEKMKKELEEKEAKYAEMDASVEAADNLEKTDEDDDTLYRSDDTMYRIREEAAPINTGIGYKVFVLKNGELYPPMVANPNGEATPVGVWLDADAAPIAGQSKTGRSQVKAGGKGTQGGSGKLAYRPGWHLGEIPYALQFNRNDENGERTLFPANFVWAEVEYANDVDYQEEAMSYGYNQNGKFQHSYAGLPRVPENGAYTYRTNPNPETDPWIITGAMRVNRLLTPTEVDKLVKAAGREPQRRQDGAITDEQINALNAEIANDYRDGVGTYTDDELAMESDPVSKALGKPRGTRKQRREFAERERRRMAERVEKLAKKLHLDNVEVVTDASTLEGKKQRAKGFYSKSTGKITIVIPNHTSTFDVEQTLLHEAVAHYGLRQLFGEHFDTFLDNVFNNAEESIRRRIVDMAAKNGWDFRKATEEYLASLAEDTEFENINAGWWRQIKDFFLNMLHKIGFEDFRGVTLSDNELRYILWRSYENLAEPGRYRSILGEASDVAKQYELKVGNYAVADPHRQTVAENDDALYRDGDPERHERELARDRYERRVKSGMFQSQEALQDSMLGLKEAMTAILGKETNIEDVDGFENAYLGENRLSSVNKAEADAFAHTLFKPMLDEVAKLARTEAEREELTDYMMAKHGLERNTYMRNEAINNGATNADQTDYAGLTALTGMDNVADAEAEAQLMIDDYEQAHDTADLWEKVNAVSKAILSKSYECGMMSKSTFDKISGMYDFYIPLRGFDEKTSSEAYAYLTHKQSAFNAPIKKAEGRRSKADDPFANLQSMAEGAIMQGNRNKLVKQRFLNFALNHPSDLASVSDIWVEYDAVANEWKPVFPDNIDSTDTPEVVDRKMLDFETKMESLAQQYPDRYKHGKDTVNIPYRIVESRDMRQHQIVVKRGGRDYVITINGNPRAAQALNGQTNPDNDMSGAIGAILRAGENINRQLSAFYTTRNPDFIVSNFMRDMLYTNTMTWIRESPNYALRFHRNYMYANPVRIKQLLAKHRKGTLDMGNKTEAMFHQFMMNGGETGYANIRDIEQHKNDIRRELKKSNGKIPVKKAWDLLGERFDEYNRAVENSARFAAFMTSREMGRSIDRAIYDAKEISVNFNKKGSGAKFYDSTGQTKTGNASALVSGLGRSGYVFWNAAIQGTANFGRQMKRHPAKAFTGIAAIFLLGAIVAYLGGDDDDDDDKNAYYNLPEYVRRSNILFRAGNSWVSIPLPVEYRAVYGMGELMISALNGKEHLTGGEIAESIAGQATQILPIDFLEGGGGLNAFVPSAYKPLWEAYVAEKSWTGMPLYKNTPWNKDMPEWTKAYKSANKYIVGLANVMNEATGGDPYTKGAIDLNPAKIEYMLNGYFGGVFGTIDKLSKTAETIAGDREYDPRSILLVNRLVKAGDERTEYRAVNNEYFRLKEEHDRLKSRLKHYEEDTDNGIFDYAEKIDFLYNSPEYERYEIFEDYREDIDDLYNELKEAISDEERKDIEAELNEVKKEMIDEINLTRKRK